MAGDFKCKMCGLCCKYVGASYWRPYAFDKTAWDKLPKHVVDSLKQFQKRYDYIPWQEYENWPCDMLFTLLDGRRICLLQKFYGGEAKPEPCQQYPFLDGDLGEICEFERRERNGQSTSFEDDVDDDNDADNVLV